MNARENHIGRAAKFDRCSSIDQIADRVGVSRRRIYKSIESGELRARKIGRRTVIHENDFQAWLDGLPTL